MEITIYGVLVGAVLPLFGYLAFHWLAESRDKSSRFARACNDFREQLLNSTSSIPNKDLHWSNNVLKSLPKITNDIEVIVAIFKYFLPKGKKEQFGSTWNELKDLIENKIPQAQSTANVMYRGGQLTPEESKTQFHELKNKLISFANET